MEYSVSSSRYVGCPEMPATEFGPEAFNVMYGIRSRLVEENPGEAVELMQNPVLSKDTRVDFQQLLIKKFSSLGKKFKELDFLNKGRIITYTACALVGKPAAVTVAANFFNFKVKQKYEEIKREIESPQEKSATSTYQGKECPIDTSLLPY